MQVGRASGETYASHRMQAVCRLLHRSWLRVSTWHLQWLLCKLFSQSMYVQRTCATSAGASKLLVRKPDCGQLLPGEWNGRLVIKVCDQQQECTRIVTIGCACKRVGHADCGLAMLLHHAPRHNTGLCMHVCASEGGRHAQVS